MIGYLIIDDEEVAHDIIKGYCDMLPNMHLMKHCYDALEAFEYLREHKVDLIFLDLNMPKLKGFDFLRTLSNPPEIIVTTAYKEYALEGYELNIKDYLLKPFGFERFLKAINRTMYFKNGKPEPPITEGTKDSLFLYSDKKHIQIKISDILYIEAAGNYSKVVLKDNNILIREKISEVSDQLSKKDFIQVHKSFIVSKENIDRIEGNRIVIGNRPIPIGKFYKVNVIGLLK